ncbi:DsrE family protein [Ferrimonas futtsuensis]|uniref:DsrE family protein n=1 Tax=Ferrimonas futtsuensis TaxID=364764 RepID=UPI00041FB50E|nr:DsrE family protein [Ferrimonas futtsuensis]
MPSIRKLLLIGLPLLACLNLVSAHATERPLDTQALKGVAQGKALFDINLSELEKLPLYLQVIEMTHDGLTAQGTAPDFVIAFRGASVQFIHGQDGHNPARQKIASQIQRLKARGVRMEACSIATELFGVDNSQLLPGIEPVGNTFISLIGYQSQGYSSIVIM